MKKIAIIGGGISGLAAAYFLQQKSKQFEISLFEEKSRVGGVIETESRDGMVLESGPDCFLAKKTAVQDLCTQIGLSGELIPTREAYRRSFIYFKKKMHPVPQGFYLIAPEKFSTLISMPLLSPFGKIRAAMDLVIPKGTRYHSGDDNVDESVASFIKRRLGREVYQRIGQPMVGGIYGGDPETLSVQAALPQFVEMEEKHGSILRALRRQPNKTGESASGPRYGLFLTLRQGMEQLVRRLVLELNRVKIYTACPVSELRRQNSKWLIQTKDGREFEADAVLAAVPSPVAAAMIRDTAADLAKDLAGISYESMATVNLIYRKSDIKNLIPGAGFVIPKIEKTFLTACSISSQKFEGRVPEDHVLVRAFAGGALYPDSYECDDRTLQEETHQEIARILDLNVRPILTSIKRFPSSMPQYEVGHKNRIAEIRRKLNSYPGLFLTGNAYEGIGIPDCIEQAQKQVATALDFLK